MTLTYGICYIWAKNGLIANTWKTNVSVEPKFSDATIGIDLGHDLDLDFSRPDMDFTVSQQKNLAAR